MTNAEAINVLLNEWKCIDRNDGLNCNRKCESCDLVMDSVVLKDAYNLAIKALEAQRWIPCSERMPEEREWIGTKEFGTTISDEVYVTIEVSSGKRITRHMCFENGSIPAFEQRGIDVFYKGGKAVAWMPLPEPYQEGAQE